MLSYFASRRTPTISSCPLFSMLDPNRWPIGSSFGKYFRAAASLMITTFGAVALFSWSVNPRPRSSGMPITSKKLGETTSLLIESCCAPSS
jgi:hypothetical protein